LALERGSNALGLSTTERDKFVEKNTLPIFDGTQEYCLWLGCMGGYDPRGREIVVALVRVIATWARASAFYEKKSVPAIRFAGWATICSFNNWQRRIWRRWRRIA